VLLHAAEYRPTHKKPLVLGLLGLNSNAAIYLNGQLPKENYNIFKKAMTMKKQKLQSAVFVRRGFVHVRVHGREDVMCLETMHKLYQLQFELSPEQLSASSSFRT